MPRELSANSQKCLFWAVQYSSVRYAVRLCTWLLLSSLTTQDRENESRFGATPVPGKIGMAMAGQGLNAQPPPRPPHHNYFGTQQNPGNQLYVGNVSLTFSHFDACLRSNQLPYQAGWQDLKDLFRAAGNIIRADINIGADGRPKGSGTVVFETQKDAQQAISSSCCLISSTDSLIMLQVCITALTGTVALLKSVR